MKIIISLILLLNSLNIFSSALSDGAIISRNIINKNGDPIAFYKHYGVMYKGKVCHYNESGYHYTSIDEFARGQKVTVVSAGLSKENLKKFNDRIKSITAKYKNSKYDAIHNNCEHFAMELVFGIKRSVQSDLTKDMILTYWSDMKSQMIKRNGESIKPYIDVFDVYLNEKIK